MTTSQHSTQQLRQLYSGGNWTEVSIRETHAGWLEKAVIVYS